MPNYYIIFLIKNFISLIKALTFLINEIRMFIYYYHPIYLFERISILCVHLSGNSYVADISQWTQPTPIKIFL